MACGFRSDVEKRVTIQNTCLDNLTKFTGARYYCLILDALKASNPSDLHSTVISQMPMTFHSMLTTVVEPDVLDQMIALVARSCAR